MACQSTRRRFLQVAGSTAVLGRTLMADDRGARRKMTMDLVCGNIGVKVNLPGAVELAHDFGFESVAPDAEFLGALDDDSLRVFLDNLKRQGLTWGASGLKVDFRSDDDRFRDGMKELPGFARNLQRAGATRVGTWIKPAHDQLSYAANLDQHARRLREVAAVLGDHGIRLGLEYVGPKTSWTAAHHPFIHTMAGMKELIAEIGRDNVGLVLDSWHWYTAGETVADLKTLTARDVVACDLNDAPLNIPRDQQKDLVRELPCATGVIDLKSFLGALLAMGYDGPVRAEPFNSALRALPPREAVAATAKAMKQAFLLIA
jgi:sugar phosphate isomerase/epimerase